MLTTFRFERSNKGETSFYTPPTPTATELPTCPKPPPEAACALPARCVRVGNVVSQIIVIALLQEYRNRYSVYSKKKDDLGHIRPDYYPVCWGKHGCKRGLHVCIICNLKHSLKRERALELRE